jgi:hypothetical protein
MEALSNGVEDYLIEGLSFKLPPGSSYITDRRKTTFWASGSNIYKPLAGTKVVRFVLSGEDGQWIDPATIRVQFDLKNNESVGLKYVRPLGNPHLFFSRARVLIGNQLVEDINFYNRTHEMFFSLMPDNVRDNVDCEGFGYRWDDKTTKWGHEYTDQTMPGVGGGDYKTVSFKPLLGLTMQSKLIPVKFAPIILELEVVNSNLDPIITPGKRNTHYDSNIVFVSGTANPYVPATSSTPAVPAQAQTGIDWSIENICIKCDCCTLDNSLNNEYVSLLLKGGALPLKYSTFINQVSSISGKNVAIQVARAVSRLQKCFITLYKNPTNETILDKQSICFYHPMDNLYRTGHELEFQIQLGSKLYPEYPVRSVSECFSILKQTLNLPDWGLHSVGIDYHQYIDNKFIFGMSFEKVPESSWTGSNTKAGQVLIVKMNAVDQASMDTDIANLMYITLVSEQILEIRDVGVSVYD